MATTNLQGLSAPDNTTAPNVLGARILSLANQMERQLLLVFHTAADRDSAVTAPTRGMIAYLDTPSPGKFTWYDGARWNLLMDNVTQEKKGNFYSGGSILPNNAATAYDEDITVAGACVIEADVSAILTVADGVTAAGYLGIRIGGINVRNARYHNYGSTKYMTVTGTGVANVPAAATVNVQFDVNVDGTASGNVQVRDVNYAIRERSPR